MSFASPVFLFAFFPAFLLLYRLLPAKARPCWLLLASLAFCFWSEPVYLLLMAAVILVTWCAGFFTERMKEQGKEKAAGAVAAAGVLIILAGLIWFRYAEFLLTTLKDLFHTRWQISAILPPAGISICTFQAMGYLRDVRRGTIHAIRNPIRLGACIAMFPQLIAGPIVRAGDVLDDLGAPKMTLQSAWHGMIRFIRGLGRKVLLADMLAPLVRSVTAMGAENASAGLLWLAALCFAFQIYFDLSGYSDMAIGIAEILGFHFHENFRTPYKAASIRDFWSRWFISLSRWLREYVYTPLGGSKKGLFRTCLNLTIVCLICGVWHGAGWNFILWGLWHGMWLVVERLPSVEAWRKKIPRTIRWFFTMVIVLLGWVLFMNTTLPDALLYLRCMFVPEAGAANAALPFLTFRTVIVLIAGGICASPVAAKLTDMAECSKKPYVQTLRSIFALVVLVLCVILLMSDTCNPSICFRF